MTPSKPRLYAVVTKSKTVLGNLSLRAVKDGRQVPVQTVMADAGFVPDDLVVILLKSEYDEISMAANSARHHKLVGDRPYMD